MVGLYFTYQQVQLLKQERREERVREQEVIQSGERGAEGVHRLCVLMPLWHGSGNLPGMPQGLLYTILFPDPEDRQKIESHLIRMSAQRNAAEARDITPDMLRMPIMQETIRLVEERFEHTRRENPQLAAAARLV